ncbi:MAG: hypothetical protein QOH54_1269 [Mycobacterium sp.]|nr:hypothetical protein [Mycobacterium sp.]
MPNIPPSKPSKPDRLPWEDQPHTDPGKATEYALVAAQKPHVDPKSAAVRVWARTAFDDETEKVRKATSGHAGGKGRNNVLFASAAALYEIVAADALDETEVENALRAAMRDNGYEDDKGVGPITATLKSARGRGRDNPRDLSDVGKGRVYIGDLDEPEPPVQLNDFQNMERGFWTSRESLQTIYLAALSRMCSPWAVLAYCAARTLTTVRPNAVLPPLIGEGSLNWFGTIAAPSGGGKGSASAVARHLIPAKHILTRNLGSGEGIIDAYVKPADKETGEPRGLHESVMFVADEIDGLKALGMRAGSTLPAILRSGFSGETLGFSYRTASSLHLEAQSYRMTLVLSMQPAKAGALLDDPHGGTLQRFMWFPGTDQRITIETPPMPAPLELTSPSAWLYPRELQIPYEAVELIRDERVRSMRGETDVLDGHSLFIREKFAFALTVLDGRDEMTLEDWRLAGIASRVSDHTRTWVAEQLVEVRNKEATERGTLAGVSQIAADKMKDVEQSRKRSVVAGWITKKLTVAYPNGLALKGKQGLAQLRNGPDRYLVESAMGLLVDRETVTQGTADKADADYYTLTTKPPTTATR